MTPEQLKALFDSNAVIVAFIVGLIVKYVPAFAKVENAAIGWINAIGYILVRFFAPTAVHAAGLGDLAKVVPDLGCIIVGGFTTSLWARSAYETLGRPLLERLLHLKKAVPA